MTEPLIPAALRAQLKALRLSARHAQSAQGFGQHASRHRGAGLEFAQYRAYEPGDEPRRIDWKLYARSDRYFVRDAERDSRLTLWLLIDATASMAQEDAARPGWSRLGATKTLAACAAEIALAQGDAFGLIAIGERVTALAAEGGPRHRDRLHIELQRLSCAGRWPDESALRPLWERIEPGALVLALSDAFDPAWPALLERLAAARREVLSVQLLTVGERDFPYAGGYLFRDPETGAERRVEGAAARADFLVRFAQARADLARRLAAGGIRHLEYVLDEPLERPLQQLFSPQRSRESGS